MNDFIVAMAEKCIGCHTCEVACAVIHAGTIAVSPENYFPRLNVVSQREISVPVMCRQCDNAPCVEACPVAALRKGTHGIEAVNERCIDCKSCMLACPFGAIEITRTAASPGRAHCLIVKCDLCEGHDGPACIRVCPTQALTLFTPSTLSEQQKQRQQHTSQRNPLSAHYFQES